MTLQTNYTAQSKVRPFLEFHEVFARCGKKGQAVIFSAFQQRFIELATCLTHSTISPKCHYTSTRLYGVMAHKAILSIITTVSASDPTVFQI
jgi:hypothetical protein